MGRRQRHSEFVRFSLDELERMAKDKSRTRAERLKLVAELKFWKARNRQKRSK
jgi:Arc/MetJ-type ribon-helix-helix transcriptional regulator